MACRTSLTFITNKCANKPKTNSNFRNEIHRDSVFAACARERVNPLSLHCVRVIEIWANGDF